MTGERDRDPAGRPRQARPRDALGRPLPYGAVGVEPVSEEPLPPVQTLEVARALVQEGRPFSAHEVLEARWKAGPERGERPVAGARPDLRRSHARRPRQRRGGVPARGAGRGPPRGVRRRRRRDVRARPDRCGRLCAGAGQQGLLSRQAPVAGSERCVPPDREPSGTGVPFQHRDRPCPSLPRRPLAEHRGPARGSGELRARPRADRVEPADGDERLPGAGVAGVRRPAAGPAACGTRVVHADADERVPVRAGRLLRPVGVPRRGAGGGRPDPRGAAGRGHPQRGLPARRRADRPAYRLPPALLDRHLRRRAAALRRPRRPGALRRRRPHQGTHRCLREPGVRGAGRPRGAPVAVPHHPRWSRWSAPPI